jgi:ppGpp synthetase/RelA/SpoT-type nucleotidyltranferase
MQKIEEFLRHYEREFDYFQEAARITARKCELALSDAGVRNLVTFRAKRVDRLREKLKKRNESHPYPDVEAIRSDIVDLAGVRIALFFPGDRPKAETFIETNFLLAGTESRKEFPEGKLADHQDPVYTERFLGYCATHYRVRNRPDSLSGDERRFENATIEIQVGSVLMLAWQEVHHDLGYKPLSGTLSEDERAILDEVNGLVIAGEIAFERLQRAVERRLEVENSPFGSHYDLAVYLDRAARSRVDTGDQTS